LAVGTASEEVVHLREEIGEPEREETLGSPVVLREGREGGVPLSRRSWLAASPVGIEARSQERASD
jgi:hypothetical protein